MREQSVVADNMRIDWDVPISMDDGLILRADVYRPLEEGQYPVILTYGTLWQRDALSGWV